jgi:radical SAM superfamily enzyme with C-terminal helix-hairpin-helix motif
VTTRLCIFMMQVGNEFEAAQPGKKFEDWSNSEYIDSQLASQLRDLRLGRQAQMRVQAGKRQSTKDSAPAPTMMILDDLLNGTFIDAACIATVLTAAVGAVL